MSNRPHKKITSLLLVLLMSATVALFAPQTAYAITCGAAGFTDIGGGVCRGFLTSGTSWTVPTDWSSTNTIEVIGGGGGGAGGGSSAGNSGGGAGGYSKSTNLTLSGTVTYQVGSAGGGGGSGNGGTGGDTIFNGTGTTCDGTQTSEVCAKGGTGGISNTTASAGVGGQQTGNTGGVGTIKNKGGNGGLAGSSAGGGGGGAAGSNGDGNAGNAGVTNTGGSGGQGDATSGGAGGTILTPAGVAGTEWDGSHGSGGGGSGLNQNNTTGTGGAYGGASGGSGKGKTASAAGAQGIIVITYTAQTTVAPTVTTNSAESFTPDTANLFGSITVQGGADATQSGFAYGTVSTLSTVIATTTLGAQTGTASFSSAVASLSANTTYYYRAYATNSAGTGYGSILSFITGNATPSRKMRLFEGFKIKFVSGTMRLYQQ